MLPVKFSSSCCWRLFVITVPFRTRYALINESSGGANFGCNSALVVSQRISVSLSAVQFSNASSVRSAIGQGKWASFLSGPQQHCHKRGGAAPDRQTVARTLKSEHLVFGVEDYGKIALLSSI
eukprot:3377921-Ditylum_brightwellii.AAC.1